MAQPPPTVVGLPSVAQEVVGFGSSPDVQRAVLWVRGKAQALAGLGGAFTEAVAVNDDGTIAGNVQDTNGDYHAVVWTR